MDIMCCHYCRTDKVDRLKAEGGNKKLEVRSKRILLNSPSLDLKYINIAFLCASVSLCLILLFAGTKSHAANLSFDIGRNSSGISVGRDFKFGYTMLGISTAFVTDAPWSYVQTKETLNEQCDNFKSQYDPAHPPDKLIKNCIPKGNFHDGDEWEVYGKAGYRLPLISMIYLNAGMGISRQRRADLYLFSEEYCTVRAGDGTCANKPEYSETWGRVKDHYYLNLLGGVGISMTSRMLFNIDYHTRKGLLGGIMYRF